MSSQNAQPEGTCSHPELLTDPDRVATQLSFQSNTSFCATGRDNIAANSQIGGSVHSTTNYNNYNNYNIPNNAPDSLEDDEVGTEPGTTSVQPPKDPTWPLEAKSPDIKPDLVDLKKWSRRLTKDRFLVLRSEDSELLADFGYSIAKGLKARDRRLLGFDRKNLEEFDPQFEMLYDETIKTATPSLVMVMANVNQSRSFIASMPTGDITAVHHFTASLVRSDLNRYVLLLGTPDCLSLGPIYDSFREDIDFLLPRLKHHYPTNFASLHERLCQQRSNGRWSADSKEFFGQLLPLFKAHVLEQELDRREHGLPDESAIAKAQTESKALLASNDTLRNTVLFIATFFPGLSAQDFEDTVLCLVGELVADFALPGDTSAEASQPEAKSARRLLKDVWAESHREVLESCRLEFQQLEGLVLRGHEADDPMAPVAEFTDPHLRRALGEVFRGSAFKTYLYLVDRVFSQGLLFRHPSDMVMEGVIRLVVATDRSSLERYGQDWLLDLILKSNLIADPKAKVGNQIRGFVNAVRPDLFYYRMKHLIIEMVSHERLRGLVDNFFLSLIQNFALYNARELLWRLRSTDRIDIFRLWKRLLDCNRSKTSRAVYSNIIANAIENEQRLVETLVRLGEWLPKPGLSATTDSERNAPALITHLCLEISLGKRARPETSWPPSNPILKVLAGSQAAPLRARLFPGLAELVDAQAEIGAWRNFVFAFVRIRLLSREVPALLPGQENALARDMVELWAQELITTDHSSPDSQLSPYLPQALIFADWALDLLGFETVPTEARAQFDDMVDAILETFDLGAQGALHRHWAMVAYVQGMLLQRVTGLAGLLVTDDVKSIFHELCHRLLREMAVLNRLSACIDPPLEISTEFPTQPREDRILKEQMRSAGPPLHDRPAEGSKPESTTPGGGKPATEKRSDPVPQTPSKAQEVKGAEKTESQAVPHKAPEPQPNRLDETPPLGPAPGSPLPRPPANQPTTNPHLKADVPSNEPTREIHPLIVGPAQKLTVRQLLIAASLAIVLVVSSFLVVSHQAPTPSAAPAQQPTDQPSPPPAAQQLLSEGKQKLAQGQKNAGRDAYARATQLAPDDAYAWANLGAAEMLLGNVESGERAYLKALQLDADNWLARYNLATHLARSGRREEALEHLDKAISTLRRSGETKRLEDVRRDMTTSSAFTELRDDQRFQRLLGR